MYFPEAGNCAKFQGDAIIHSSDKSSFVKTVRKPSKINHALREIFCLFLPTQKCPEVLSHSFQTTRYTVVDVNQKYLYQQTTLKTFSLQIKAITHGLK